MIKMLTKTQERIFKNDKLKQGVHCPICGKELIDLKFCDVKDKPTVFSHEYWCDNCLITIRIHVD